jgi:hypothetical protein
MRVAATPALRVSAAALRRTVAHQACSSRSRGPPPVIPFGETASVVAR